MASNVEISNVALTLIGANRITSLTQDSETAREVNAIYSIVRDEVLRAHTWNFATTRRTLAQLSTTPNYDYDYEYQLPAECLRVIHMRYQESYSFRVEGRKILSNNSTCQITYTKREEDPAQWDAMFIGAFAARLAAELSFNNAANATFHTKMMELYQRKLNIAKGADSQEGTPQSLVTNVWEDSRLVN